MSGRFGLKGKTPESWACVDCDVNTAPGHPTRVEWERLYKTAVAIKKLSGKASPLATVTYDERCEVYTVRDAVWKAADGRLPLHRLSRKAPRSQAEAERFPTP